MNILTLLLQAGAASKPQGGSQLGFWLVIILVFVVMWLFLIRPQRKQQKELEKFRAALKRGDKVVTVGGIYGTVDEIKDGDKSILIKVDGDVKLRVDKNSLVRDYSDTAQK
ncbi:MAG: preprotein translocase subunit YajC [Bacteroidales bacterium]|jgi:preprotein translocase subunit YajC|nr:preprotein translocase subunit YajC [Bacteroidales bacterium]MCI1786148.1 preprotein translocase subunit YajC [Bacteroidales bacterium]